MTLTLVDPLWYSPSESSFDDIIASLPSKERGYDAFILYTISMSEDSMEIVPERAGERNGYSEEDRRRIESGLSPLRKDTETEEIPSGKYTFEQFPALFTSADLPRIILPYSASAGKVYVRIFKESVLESVMQLMLPL